MLCSCLCLPMVPNMMRFSWINWPVVYPSKGQSAYRIESSWWKELSLDWVSALSFCQIEDLHFCPSFAGGVQTNVYQESQYNCLPPTDFNFTLLHVEQDRRAEWKGLGCLFAICFVCIPSCFACIHRGIPISPLFMAESQDSKLKPCFVSHLILL